MLLVVGERVCVCLCFVLNWFMRKLFRVPCTVQYSTHACDTVKMYSLVKVVCIPDVFLARDVPEILATPLPDETPCYLVATHAQDSGSKNASPL